MSSVTENLTYNSTSLLNIDVRVSGDRPALNYLAMRIPSPPQTVRLKTKEADAQRTAPANRVASVGALQRRCARSALRRRCTRTWGRHSSCGSGQCMHRTSRLSVGCEEESLGAIAHRIVSPVPPFSSLSPFAALVPFRFRPFRCGSRAVEKNATPCHSSSHARLCRLCRSVVFTSCHRSDHCPGLDKLQRQRCFE